MYDRMSEAIENKISGASLTDKQVAEFQELYKKHYGIELTKNQAYDKGFRLVRLMRAVLEPALN